MSNPTSATLLIRNLVAFPNSSKYPSCAKISGSKQSIARVASMPTENAAAAIAEWYGPVGALRGFPACWI
jgi:hypothetical protein